MSQEFNSSSGDLRSFREYLESRYTYLGQCDRLRMIGSGNEAAWQVMMKNARPVPSAEFFKNVDFSRVMDDDETVEQWMQSNHDAQFFKSVWNGRPAYFAQTGGFEFIFAA